MVCLRWLRCLVKCWKKRCATVLAYVVKGKQKVKIDSDNTKFTTSTGRIPVVLFTFPSGHACNTLWASALWHGSLVHEEQRKVDRISRYSLILCNIFAGCVLTLTCTHSSRLTFLLAPSHTCQLSLAFIVAFIHTYRLWLSFILMSTHTLHQWLILSLTFLKWLSREYESLYSRVSMPNYDCK